MNSKNPFHVKDYRRWFVGETLLSVSAGMGLATMLLAVEIFDSVATAGLFFSVVSLLGILGSAVGGSLADSVQRRSLFKVFSPVVIICSLGIAITVSGYFYANWTTQAAVMTISSFVLISSAITGVLDPVMDAVLKNVISPEQFPRAVGVDDIDRCQPGLRCFIFCAGTSAICGAVFLQSRFLYQCFSNSHATGAE